jgi:putative sigma-54 modulation protein
MRNCAISMLAFAALATNTHAFMGGAPAFMRGAVSGLRTTGATTTALRSLNMAAGQVPIQITGQNIDVTPALKDYINEKFGRALSKTGKRVTKCDVTLVYDKNPAIAEPNQVQVTLFAKGAQIRAHKGLDDMYAAIDQVSDTVKRKLRKYKERVIESHRKGSSDVADVTDEDIQAFMEFNQDVEQEMKAADVFDVPAPDMSKIVKTSFNMDPVTVAEAVLCLEYTDHSFYAFRNKDNGNKACVVYERNGGGIGLIEQE